MGDRCEKCMNGYMRANGNPTDSCIGKKRKRKKKKKRKEKKKKKKKKKKVIINN